MNSNKDKEMLDERLRTFLAQSVAYPPTPGLEDRLVTRLNRHRTWVWPFVTGTFVVAGAAAVVVLALAAHSSRLSNTAPATTPTPTQATPTPSITARWKTLSDPAGSYSFRYPSSWKVSGPCVSGPQMVGGTSSQDVLVGPTAIGCGASGGMKGVDVSSTTDTSYPLLQQSQYPGDTLTTTQVIVGGVAGTRQSLAGTQTAFVTYTFVTGGRLYLVFLDEIATPDIPVTTIDALVTQTLQFHS